jgi:hypothetical protein
MGEIIRHFLPTLSVPDGVKMGEIIRFLLRSLAPTRKGFQREYGSTESVTDLLKAKELKIMQINNEWHGDYEIFSESTPADRLFENSRK